MKTILIIPILLLVLALGQVQAQTEKNQKCALLERPVVTLGNCLNDSIIFDAGTFNNAQYSWDFNGDGIYEMEKIEKGQVKFQFLNAGTYQPQVVIFTDSCTNGNKNETQENLQILPVAKPVFKIENNNCNNIKLERILAANDQADSIVWKISDGSVYRTNVVEHSFELNAGSKFEVSLSTFKGECQAMAYELVEFENVVAQPIVELSSQCAPAQLSLKNADLYENANFAWYINGAEVSNMPNFSLDIQEAAEMKISLAIDNNYGCADSLELKNLVKVANPVLAKADVLKNDLCLGETVALNEQNEGHNFRTVLWGDGTIDTLLRDVKHHYESAGSYQITVIAENTKFACTDTFVFDKKIVVYNKPEVDFAIQLDGTCTPQVLEIKNNSKGFYNTYKLMLNDYDTLTFSDATIIKNPGLHQVRLQLINEKANCKAEAVQVFKLYNPYNKNIAPAILETSLEENAFTFSWAGIENANYYEVYKIGQEGQSLVAKTTDTLFVVNDYAADSNFSQYAVKAYDQCGVGSGLSATAQAIALSGTYQVDSFPILQWTAFGAWNENLTHYVIEKNIGNNWEMVGQSKQPHFIDKNFDNNETLEATYRVKAIHANGFFQSVSTEYTFNFMPNIFVPSAFSPNYDNINDEYVVIGQGMKECNIQIFNSWGQRIFASNGENKAWDGKYNGEMVEAGTYVCVVGMQTPEGRNYSFERTITLIR